MNSINASVLYEVDERGIARVTLNNPDKHNAFDDQMIATLTDMFRRAGQDELVRALILQANGKSFSAGANLQWMQRMASYTEQQNEQDAMALATMLQTLYTLPKPTIARVQGAAFGGAVGLIACCDIAIGNINFGRLVGDPPHDSCDSSSFKMRVEFRKLGVGCISNA